MCKVNWLVSRRMSEQRLEANKSALFCGLVSKGDKQQADGDVLCASPSAIVLNKDGVPSAKESPIASI
jgi:hypothetical protein